MSWFPQRDKKKGMSAWSPRTRRRNNGDKSSRTHAVHIGPIEDEIDAAENPTSNLRGKLYKRAKSFLDSFDTRPTSVKKFEDREKEVIVKKISLDKNQRDQSNADSARTDITDFSNRSWGQPGSPGTSKLDWWFPAKAAFGRKKVINVEELFSRLTRSSRQTGNWNQFDSFLVRESVDVDKIEARQSEWIDRGKGYFQKLRKKNKQAALLETGTHAGRSLVQLAGIKNMTWHRLRHDAFSSLISMKFSKMVLMCCSCYVFVWFFFAFIWWSAYYVEPDCFTNMSGFLDSLVLSISTANTIGYGIRAIRGNLEGDVECIYSIAVLSIERLVVIIMDALLIGVLFSKLSQPKKRSRTIFISDSAVVCQRDGLLKFMFRVGDARQTTIIRPCIQAFLYTFNPSRRRTTLEGEFIPNRVSPLKLEVMDESLLLPLLVSHVIDERSPLFGLTKDDLEELRAEIVVTFVAVNSETGAEFAARQSYLPSEIFYGFQFTKIIKSLTEGDYKYHAIDLAKFHDIEPQKLWNNVFMTQNEISRILMNSIGNSLTVPVPLIGENTLVVSGSAALTTVNKKMKLCFRVADVFPPHGQFLEAKVYAYYYPWKKDEGAGEQAQTCCISYGSCKELLLGTNANPSSNRLFLRTPMIVSHVIDKTSPLWHWQTRGGFSEDGGAEVLVIVTAINQVTQANERVQRTYRVGEGHIRLGERFTDIMDDKNKINYDYFHQLTKDDKPSGDNCWIYDDNGSPFEPTEPLTQVPEASERTFISASTSKLAESSEIFNAVDHV